MGRENRRIAAAMRPGAHAKERHKKYQRARVLNVPVSALNARLEPPSMKSKHHSYYEIVENKDKKKKKLEFENTSRRTPPPGFEFVPVGNPELTTACKELSREQDAMIFVVSNNSEAGSLSQHMNRIGYHIREAIVQQARREVSDTGDSSDDQVQPGVPEPIPDSQDEINAQADLAIRDLFPRIPNTDRVAIIEHAFRKGAHKKGEPLVGLAKDIPLSRRVQLAVLAHIRHTHTRYDSLLRETTYVNARKAVEQLCLDVLVKWRGDEETGRDQLDEILREVIVISDSEGEDDDDNGEDDEADSSGVESGDLAAEPSYLPYPAAGATGRRVVPEPGTASRRIQRPLAEPEAPVPMYRDETGPIFVQPVRPYMQEGYADHRARRGFKRYKAALSARWGAAVDRVRHQREHPLEMQPTPPSVPTEYRLVTRHEPLYLAQQPSPSHTLYTREAQDAQHHRVVHNPMDLPARGSIPAVLAAAHQGSLSGSLSRGASPYTDPRQSQRPHRIVVSSSEAQDLLVPSVEPLSPSSESHPTAPVFVRTVSPRQTSRPPRNLVDDIRSQPHTRDSPSWVGEPSSYKRRRPLDDEPYNPRDPPQPLPQRRIMSDGWQQPPVHYAAAQPINPSPHPVSEQDSRTHFVRVPAEYVARVPVTAPGIRNYYEASRAGPPLESENAPIVLNDWDEEPPPAAETFPVREYRGNAIPERRDPPFRIVRAREDNAQYEPAVEYRQRRPVNYGDAPGRQGGQPPISRQPPPPNDALPIWLGPSLIERPVYERRLHVSNPEMRPVGHGLASFPAAPSQAQPLDNHEPAPVFIRRIDPHAQPRLVETHGQPDGHHNPGTHRVYQTTHPAEGSWVQPQNVPPHGGPHDAAAGYNHNPPLQHRYHGGGYAYQEYPNHQGHQYNQPGL